MRPVQRFIVAFLLVNLGAEIFFAVFRHKPPEEYVRPFVMGERQRTPTAAWPVRALPHSNVCHG